MSSVIITHDDGTVYDLDKLGFRVIASDIPAPPWEHSYQQMSRYVNVETDHKTQPLTIPVSFFVRGGDIAGLQLKRLDLKRIFPGDEYFWLQYAEIKHLRWRVTAEEPQLTRINNSGYANGSVNLKCPNAFAETVANTLDDAFTYDDGKWGLGLGIPYGTTPKYFYQGTSSCEIWNFSNIDLEADDTEHHMQIIINGYCPVKLSIKNNTTGQEFVYNHGFNGKFILDGAIPYFEGDEVYRNGNHAYLDFKKGKNDISISGMDGTSWTVGFKTRFYY